MLPVRDTAQYMLVIVSHNIAPVLSVLWCVGWQAFGEVPALDLSSHWHRFQILKVVTYAVNGIMRGSSESGSIVRHTYRSVSIAVGPRPEDVYYYVET